MSDAEADRLIDRARRESLVLRFDVDHVKGGMSGERYAQYSKFTSVRECDRAVKKPFEYAGGRIATVMLRGDLRYDVASGHCVVLDGNGVPLEAAAVRLTKSDALLPDFEGGGSVESYGFDEVKAYGARQTAPGAATERKPSDAEVLAAAKAWLKRAG